MVMVVHFSKDSAWSSAVHQFHGADLQDHSRLSVESTKRSKNPTTDFPVAGLPVMGFQHFLKCSSVTMCRVNVVPSSLTRLYGVQHETASISSCGNHTITRQCFIKDVPPASGDIIHAVCRFLQSCSNARRMTCFDCLKINEEDVPTSAGCHLATHPKSGSSGSR